MRVLDRISDEETGVERMVTGLCKLCAKSWPHPNHTHYAVVSPTGVAHVGADYGMTACGKDATGEDWWWEL
jgi:hypothetical protein